MATVVSVQLKREGIRPDRQAQLETSMVSVRAWARLALPREHYYRLDITNLSYSGLEELILQSTY